MNYWKSSQMGPSFFTSLFSLLLLATVMGCESEPQVTPSAQLSIFPSERSVEIQTINDIDGNCLYQDNFFQDAPISIRLSNESGTPIERANVSVYVDYSGNTFSGLSVLKLYADLNGNGVVDALDELVSGSDDDIYVAHTAEYTGVVSLLLRINVSCPYTGQLYAFAGPVAASMEIAVTTNSVTDE